MLILEKLWFKEDGMKMKMYGHHIMISNGQQRYAISTTCS